MRRPRDALEGLTGVQLVQAVANVGNKWLDNKGKDAFTAYRMLSRAAIEQGVAIPTWCEDEPSASDEAIRASKAALDRLLTSRDPAVRAWTQEAVGQMHVVQPQVFDPVTISGGIVLCGLILAARVKSIDAKGVQFYEGLPKGLSDIIKYIFGGP